MRCAPAIAGDELEQLQVAGQAEAHSAGLVDVDGGRGDHQVIEVGRGDALRAGDELKLL